MKNVFWLLEDDAQWVRSLVVGLVVVGVIWWAVQTFDLSFQINL